MRRLSSPLGSLRASYDAVVVGTGYGGAIAASRLARMRTAEGDRLSICVLERGLERQPGEYPNTLTGVLRQSRVEHRHFGLGAGSALYDFRLGRDISVFVGSGLGGTSLVNANVMLRPRPWVLEDARWPDPLREDGELERGFERSRRMLDPRPYGDDRPALAKLQALDRVGRENGNHEDGNQENAVHGNQDQENGGHESSGGGFRAPAAPGADRPPIAVSFHTRMNDVGVQERACSGCGDCTTGCNEGAKRTLIMNYLPDAVNHGAEIHCGAAVRAVQPLDDGSWLVHFRPLDPGRDRFRAPEMFIRTRMVVLAAGTLGSTEILLRSRRRGYITGSPKLGHAFSGNGDTLAFAYNVARPVDGVGYGRAAPGERPMVGPTIAGMLDERGERGEQSARGEPTPRAGRPLLPPKRHQEIVIQEGAIPGALAPILGLGFFAAARVSRKDGGHPVGHRLREFWRELASVFGGSYRGAVRNTLTFLTMGHEHSSGTLLLHRDRIQIHWPRVGSQPLFREVASRLARATRRLGGTHIVNPIWRRGRRLVTVHPLGGCAMGKSAEMGVVNHKGQLFRGAAGQAVHENLYVTDGSVVRRSLGVNPLWTISAISERMCVLLARDREWRIEGVDGAEGSRGEAPSAEAAAQVAARDAAVEAGARAQVVARGAAAEAGARAMEPRGRTNATPSRPGIRFTERMRGVLRTDAHQGGAPASPSPFSFTVTVVADDLDRLIAEPARPAALFGTARAPALSPDPLMVTEGRFNLFEVDEKQVDTLLMRYRMTLTTRDGRTFHFSGAKTLHDQPWRMDAWRDLTRMPFTLWEQGETRSRWTGEGEVRIGLGDLVRLLLGITPTGVRGRFERWRRKLRFARHFLRNLVRVYAWPFTPADVIDPLGRLPERRALDLPPPERHSLVTKDGADIHLIRYRGAGGPPVILAPGFGTSTYAFTLHTIRVNLAEYLVARGYDVWLFDYRVSDRSAASGTQFTLDDIARHDWPDALERVHAETGRPVHLMGHCVASMTLLMALLAGYLDQDKVASVLCSQSFTHVDQSPMNRLKSRLRLASIVGGLGFWPTLNPSFDLHSSAGERFADRLLRLYPTRERCRSPVCRRILFLYGEVFLHDRLNAATHRAVYDMFSRGNLTTLRHLSRVVAAGRIVDPEGGNRYLKPENAARIRVPVTLLQGKRNPIFRRRGGQQSLAWLLEHAGDASAGPSARPSPLIRMREEELRDYGHMDLFIGAEASRDVYPVIEEEIVRAEELLEARRSTAAAAETTAARSTPGGAI